MNKKIKLFLPFQRIHFKYKESNYDELDPEEFLILNSLYKSFIKKEYDRKIFEISKIALCINDNFDDYIKEKISKIFSKKYIYLNEEKQILDLKKINKYMLQDIKLHSNIENNFNNKNPIGFKIDNSEKELFIYKSLIGKNLDFEQLNIDINKNDLKNNKINFSNEKTISFNKELKNNKELKDLFSEHIEKKFIIENDKNKKLVELNLINENELIFLSKDIDFNLNYINKTIEIMPIDKISSKIKEKIENEYKYEYLLEIFEKSILKENYIFDNKKYSKYENKNFNKNIKEILHTIDIFEEIKKMENIINEFIDKNITYIHNKWFYIWKNNFDLNIGNKSIRKNIPFIFLEEINNFEEEELKNSFLEKFNFFNYFEKWDLYWDKLLNIKNDNLNKLVIENIKSQISILKYPDFKKCSSFLKEKKLINKLNELKQYLNHNYFEKFNFMHLSDKEIYELTLELIIKNKDNEKIKKIICEKIDSIEWISESFFEQILKIYNLNPNQNIQILLKTDFLKRYFNLVTQIKEQIEKFEFKNIDIDQIKNKYNDIKKEIKEKIFNFDIELLEELKQKIVNYEEKDEFFLKTNFFIELNELWKNIEKYFKNKNPEKNISNFAKEIQNSTFLSKKEKDIFTWLRKKRNQYDHYNEKSDLKKITYQQIKEEYKNFKEKSLEIKKIIIKE